MQFRPVNSVITHRSSHNAQQICKNLNVNLQRRLIRSSITLETMESGQQKRKPSGITKNSLSRIINYQDTPQGSHCITFCIILKPILGP
ncbi:LOW QUALITY PROTEIN: hypothetical protein TorRG33x02_091800 [Trema orientale]|uniref:Uncharacterized protein n=1 Tax=Trema orientale TaxID=63057 RepID=A0A2P5FB13_TREOI|nr:LOW QUALITY PROTEIN: hypothetical protein TorRG33x02_091800 [Trema orientale]